MASANWLRHVTSMMQTPSGRRWFDIAILTATGAILFEAALPVAAASFSRVYSPLWFSPWFVWLLAWSMTAFAAFIFSEPLRLHWTQRKTFVAYPPIWLAIVGGVVLAALSERLLAPAFRPHHRALDWQRLDVLSALLSAFAVGVGIRLWANRAPRRSTPTPKPFRVREWDDIADWVHSEAPASGDVFEHALVAERIALSLSGTHPTTAVAVLGPHGSGKTTILGWVRAQLRAAAPEQNVIVDVNCWGLRRPADAPILALRNVIAALEEYVDVQAFRRLPDSYQRLVAAEPSGKLAKMLGATGERDATEELRRFQPVLEATGLRVTLIIEDADRAGTGFDSRHLERLLWTLRAIPGFTFILSMDQTKTRIDFRKLCDVIESVPPLVAERVAAVVRVAAKHWQNDFSFLDPAPDGSDDRDPLQLTNFASSMMAYSSGLSQDTPVHALIALLQTPRNLKHFLRRVDSAWTRLFGEVDLEDLIILQALRAGAPDVFSFLLENIDPARHKPEDLSARTKTVRRDWDALLRRHPQRTAVQTLVNRLGIQQLSKPVADEARKPQGIQFYRDEMDYFRRALSEQLAPNEIRDQTVIKDIVDWKSSASARMMEVLLQTPADNQYMQTWNAFAFRLTDAELQRIGETLIDSILRGRGADADMNDEEGLLATWRRFNLQAAYGWYESWLIIQIGKALPVSLNFANTLFGYFTLRGSTRLSSDACARVRSSFVGEAKARLAVPELLIRALSSKYPATLNALILGSHREQFEPLTEWTPLASVIADAVLKNPALLVPQLAILLSESSHRFERGAEESRLAVVEDVTINEDRLNQLFGDRATEILRALANASDEHPYVVAIARAATAILHCDPSPRRD